MTALSHHDSRAGHNHNFPVEAAKAGNRPFDTTKTRKKWNDYMDDREEILHLMNQYCFAVDTGDMEKFAGLFEYGQWAIEGSQPYFGKKGMLHLIKGIKIYRDGTPRTKHITTNVDIQIDNEKGVSTGQCYVTVLQETDNFPLQPIFSGHYFDEFKQVDGSWCFASRTVRFALVGNMSAHVIGFKEKPTTFSD
ncbi:MAG: nuclear transport factor 2 family protein [Desulfobacterales bacterium]